MEIVRAVRLDDVDPLFELTQRATHGLTSLQLTHDQLLQRVESSHFAFTRRSEHRSGDPYLLVMEDLNTGRLVGTSCIFARTGGYEPFYAYRVQSTQHHSNELDVHATVTALHLERIHDGPSELGSLFLLPEFRGGGRGRLLSLARFALIAQRPHRFSRRMIAEMRGVCSAEGVTPFWEAIGRHFFKVDFPVADALSTWSKQFIEQLMPIHPIYIDLLPPEARETIGQVHPETVPAATLLYSEGFQKTDMVDIFDAGPLLEQETDRIHAIARCCRGVVARIAEVESQTSGIIAAQTDGFRACLDAYTCEDGDHVVIPSRVALALGVRVGSPIWTMPGRAEKA